MAELPEPPENPFESGAPGIEGPMDTNGEEMTQGAPDVAARGGKAFFVLAVVGLVVLVLLYLIFFGGKKSDEKKEEKKITITKTELAPPPLPVTAPPTTVAPVTITAPPIPQPVEIPAITSINPLTPKEDALAKAQQLARLHSSIMINGGGSGLGGLLDGGSSSTAPTAAPTDPNSQFMSNLATTKAARVEATRIGDLHRTIAQGRIIQATMESALNTDLPAPIRAIVSRDTYAEAGTVPLIPKGSRLIGSYNTALGAGQTRVFVVWTRVIRPDGVDVKLNSPLVDQIGQAGVGGQVDSKFQEIFSRSLLSSVMNIAVGIASDKIAGGSTTTTTDPSGGSQTQGDAASTATTNALNRLGSVTDSFIQRFLNVSPTILVDQGTPVNVFVNQDLVFPEEAVGARVLN